MFYSWSQLYLRSGVVSSHSKRLKRVLPLADTHTEYPCCCLNSFLLVKPVPLLCYQNFFSATESSSITPQMWGARRQISASPKFLHCLLQRAAAVLALLLSKVELLEPKIGGEKPVHCVNNTRGKTQGCLLHNCSEMDPFGLIVRMCKAPLFVRCFSTQQHSDTPRQSAEGLWFSGVLFLLKRRIKSC